MDEIQIDDVLAGYDREIAQLTRRAVVAETQVRMLKKKLEDAGEA